MVFLSLPLSIFEQVVLGSLSGKYHVWASSARFLSNFSFKSTTLSNFLVWFVIFLVENWTFEYSRIQNCSPHQGLLFLIVKASLCPASVFERLPRMPGPQSTNNAACPSVYGLSLCWVLFKHLTRPLTVLPQPADQPCWMFRDFSGPFWAYFLSWARMWLSKFPGIQMLWMP